LFVEPGFYKVSIEDAILTFAKSSGNEMIKLAVRVILPNGQDGPLCNEYLTFSEKAAWKIDQCRAAIGEEISEGEEACVEPEDFLGKEAVCYIDKEQGRDAGKWFNCIESWIHPTEAGTVNLGPARGAWEDTKQPVTVKVNGRPITLGKPPADYRKPEPKTRKAAPAPPIDDFGTNDDDIPF
jgi:hypothetical protein